jgi:methyl-accepting chemotaxis protein
MPVAESTGNSTFEARPQKASTNFINKIAFRFVLITVCLLVPTTLVGIFWVLAGVREFVPASEQVRIITSVFWKLGIINFALSTPLWFLAFYRSIISPLRTLVLEIKDSSQTVSSSSQHLAAAAEQVGSLTLDISSSMQQISQGAELQAQKVQETSEAVKHITAAIQEIAPRARTAAQISEEAAKLAKDGENATVEAIGKINQVQDVTTRSAQAVRLLETRSGEIGRIVDMITTIANQTNLLSLNAAIEAARAGEAGRGFAVVADEVRKLADESARAAKQISKLIEEVQAETSKAVQAMEEGTQEVSAGAQVVDRAGEALKKILRVVDETAATSNEIAVVLHNQADSADIVDKAVTDIAAVVEENAAGAEETAASSEEQTASMQEISDLARQLANMSIRLENSVDVFK